MTPLYARRLLGASGLGLCLLLSACAGSSSSGESIATVNGVDIPRAEYEKRIDGSPVAKQVMTQLVQGRLLEQYATKHSITASDDEINKKLDELKARYPGAQFDLLLKNQSLTEDDVKKLVRQQILLQKSVAGNVKVTDQQIADYFTKNRELFNTPEQVHARHILVEDLPTAQKVEAELKAGAKFEDEAKKYSKDPSSKDHGGDLSFFGRKQMVPAFEDAAFSQPINVVGPPVKSQFGYHIIEVLERKPAVVGTLANSKEKIRTMLTQQQEAEKVPAFLAQLQHDAKIEIHDPNLQNALAPAAGPPPG